MKIVKNTIYQSTKQSSVLNNIEFKRPFDLAMVDGGQFHKIAKQVRRKIDAQKSIENVYVDYDNSIFKDKQLLKKTLRTSKTVKEEDSDEEVRQWRYLTKHRIVTSHITGYMITNPPQAVDPYRFLVTTTCAPNAMGTNSKDKRFFFDDDPSLQRYKNMMKLTYLRCLNVQIQNNTQVLLIPPIGLGVYLATLNETQKSKAIEANYEALRECIDEIADKGTLQEIICVMPNFNKKNDYYTTASQKLLKKSNSMPITIARVDFLETAQKLTVNGYKVGLLNAGSDRTIAGGYEKYIEAYKNDHKEYTLPPAEETLSLATDLDLQAINKIRGVFHFQKFPENLCVKTTVSRKETKPRKEQNHNEQENQMGIMSNKQLKPEEFTPTRITNETEPHTTKVDERKNKINFSSSESLRKSSNFFPAPDNQSVIKASKLLAKEMKNKNSMFIKNSNFIIRKGNYRGTFKIAFTNREDAAKFYNHLLNLNYSKKYTTFWGKEEKYPINELGQVTPQGAYRYIIRFELPKDALKYLKSINIRNAEDLYNAVMMGKPDGNYSLRPKR